MANSVRSENGWTVNGGSNFVSDANVREFKARWVASGFTFSGGEHNEDHPIEEYEEWLESWNTLVGGEAPNGGPDLRCGGYLHTEEFRNLPIENVESVSMQKLDMYTMTPVQDAVEKMVANPYWRKVYVMAPSDISRRWRELDFALSWENYWGLKGDGKRWEQYFAEQDHLEDQMDRADLMYLYRYCGDAKVKEKYKKRIEQLDGMGG